MKKDFVKNYLKLFANSTGSYEQTGLKVYNQLVENFSNTFFVGGIVRDLYLSKKVVDIDITTSAQPSQIVSALNKYNYDLDLKGFRFGVVAVRLGKRTIEITTFRKEFYLDSRFPKITFTNSKTVDSKRRDFTINSLYFQAKTNELYDPYDGGKDLKNKLIRSIGSSTKKFQEDPLRIVRAFRFAKELDFKIETKTEQAMHDNFALVKNITVTRLKNEIAKSKTVATKIYLTKIFKKLLQK